jgi:uncharacterized damage-inducible protein DinB
VSFRFLVDTYETERLKVLSVWSMFQDDDLAKRPHPTDMRGRSVREHMVHQCVGENLWFMNMLGIDVGAPPLPDEETRLEFMYRYAEDSTKRLDALSTRDDDWWQDEVSFFGVPRIRAWVMTRRVAHTAHHRGQQTTLLGIIERNLYSTYGPSADTGGLMQNKAPAIYPYADAEALLNGEAVGGSKQTLPRVSDDPVTERP